jgi:cysteine desulfurase
MSAGAPIYLDYAATTPVDLRVAAAMSECLVASGVFGNPASNHAFGRAARERVAAARQRTAALIGARAADVFYTSGATEADNLAILGLVRGLRSAAARTAAAPAGPKAAAAAPHLITARTEHKAVLDPCRQLEREGCTVSYLSPDASGRISPEQLQAALRPETVLVSLMHANNETGVIHDIAAFGALCHAHGAALHVDAAQSAGKLPIDVVAMAVDLLSFTAHKLYGPKGIGALYAHPARRVVLQPLMYGGGHERGLRSGTLPVHQIVGFGLACELAAAEMTAESTRLAGLRARLWAGLADLPGVKLNTALEVSLPGLLNVSFTGIEGESLLTGLPELALASGSACNSDSDEPSYVLRALGHDRESAQSSLRFSLGRGTSAPQIELAIAAVRREVLRLRALAGAPEGARPAGGEGGAGAGATATGEAGAREQGTWVRFMLNTRDGQIEQARYQAYGCPQTLATCEWLVGQLRGRPWHEPGVGGPLDWAQALALPPDRLTRLLVVEDALRAALEAAQQPAGSRGTMTG